MTSLIWAVGYSRAVTRWYAPLESHLRDEHGYQLTLLTGSFQGALELGVSFMRTHHDELVHLVEEGLSSSLNPHNATH